MVKSVADKQDKGTVTIETNISNIFYRCTKVADRPILHSSIFYNNEAPKRFNFIEGLTLYIRKLEYQFGNPSYLETINLIIDDLMYKLGISCSAVGHRYIKMLILDNLNRKGSGEEIVFDFKKIVSTMEKNGRQVTLASVKEASLRTIKKVINSPCDSYIKRIICKNTKDDSKQFIANCISYIEQFEYALNASIEQSYDNENYLLEIFPEISDFYLFDEKQDEELSSINDSAFIPTREDLIFNVMKDLSIPNDHIFIEAILYSLYVLDLNPNELSSNDILQFLHRNYAWNKDSILKHFDMLLIQSLNKYQAHVDTIEVVEFVYRDEDVDTMAILMKIAKYIKILESKYVYKNAEHLMRKRVSNLNN